jgi:outer membrane protein OmpU
MKRILIATTALVATAGIASAEIKISGGGLAGLIYNSEGEENVKLRTEALVTIDASGETDGGLQFGFNTNYIVGDNGTVDNDDTSLYISGAFGKLSFGAVGEADEVAGLGDIGLDGLGVDDVAEALVGDELGDKAYIDGIGSVDLFGSLGHNVNYTIATGPVTFSISGQLVSGSFDEDNNESYAAGVKYSFGDAYVGLGYANHTNKSVVTYFGDDYDVDAEADVVSLFAGGTFGAFKVAALYSQADGKVSITEDGIAVGSDSADPKAYGLKVDYKIDDALTVSFGYGKVDADGYGQDQESFGVGASYALGGGARLVGGIASVKSFGDENIGSGSDTETRADFGVAFSF